RSRAPHRARRRSPEQRRGDHAARVVPHARAQRVFRRALARALRAMKRAAYVVLFDFACRIAAGLILGAPVAAVVSASGVGAFPEGDRLLFAPGGTLLAELVRASFSLLPALATSSLATGVLLAAGLVV